MDNLSLICHYLSLQADISYTYIFIFYNCAHKEGFIWKEFILLFYSV